MQDDLPRALIIAGPTASGKSALALDIAERLDGVIINADSMQVYRELKVLTARPSAQDEMRVRHCLYGVRPAQDGGSVAWWRAAALSEMERAREQGRLPILTGGTGLYFASLTQGLSDIPAPTPQARSEARSYLAEAGPDALHRRLSAVDPTTAARLRPSDSQRIARAWEVWRSTGLGLSHWQAIRGDPAPWDFAAILLDPPRPELQSAIAHRFAAMLRAGAVHEVRALLALGLDPALPVMRAHGVPELSSYIDKAITLDEAARRTELVTRQYTKRQATWFRHHELARPPRTHTIHARYAGVAQLSKSQAAQLLSFVETVA